LKRTAITFITLAAACIVLGSCAKNTPSEGMQLLSDASCDFTLEVPSDWEISYTSSMLAAYDTADKTNVTAFSIGLQEEMGADDFWEDRYKPNFEDTFGTMNVNAKEETKLSGVIARHVFYTVDMGEDSFNCQTVICVRMGNVYMVTFTATPETYDSHTEEFEKILSSYKFK